MLNYMQTRGFSLVELSIVLVILGLLTGGILGGQSLIRASELRAVSSEYSRYVTAVGTFRDKYFAIPGDMTNAQSFWGAAATCPGDHTQGSTNAATCNGNGNGIVEYSAATGNENYRFWQHLANAGLVEGTYSGVSGGAGTPYTSVIGTNVPRSKLSNAGWTAHAWTTIDATDANLFEGSYGNVFAFGGASTNSITETYVMKPEEAWNIDTKMDDGRPAIGSVRTYERDTNCHTSTTAANANYALSNNIVQCALVFLVKY